MYRVFLILFAAGKFVRVHSVACVAQEFKLNPNDGIAEPTPLVETVKSKTRCRKLLYDSGVKAKAVTNGEAWAVAQESIDAVALLRRGCDLTTFNALAEYGGTDSVEFATPAEFLQAAKNYANA
jgi:hypothetical protein